MTAEATAGEARIDAASAAPPVRVAVVDALRGVAIVAMVIYHFAWDLRFFGYIGVDVAGDLGWRLFARGIAATFLALVGVGLVLSVRNGLRIDRFLRRLAVIGCAALAVTSATWFAFPDAFIFFGILHAIAVFSVLGLAFVRAPLAVIIPLALLVFIAPSLLTGPAFDHPALVWLGLSSVAPRSNDFVPLFPWFGVTLAGMAAARVVVRFWPAGKTLPAGSAPRPLVWAGRHSLAIYLIHQPLMLGLVYLATQVAPPEPVGFAAWHLESCTRQCVESGVGQTSCQNTCGCLTERSEAEGLAAPLLRNVLSEAQLSRYFELAGQCRAAPRG